MGGEAISEARRHKASKRQMLTLTLRLLTAEKERDVRVKAVTSAVETRSGIVEVLPVQGGVYL